MHPNPNPNPAQAPTQAQVLNTTVHTHAHTHMHTPTHTAGVKRRFEQTVSPKGLETTATGSGVGLGPGPKGALTLTAPPPTHPTTTSTKTSGKWRDPPKFSDPVLIKLHKDLAVLSTKLEKAKHHKELLDGTMNNCERGPVGLRDPTVPQVMDANKTKFRSAWNQLVLDYEELKQKTISDHYSSLITQYEEEISELETEIRKATKSGKVTQGDVEALGNLKEFVKDMSELCLKTVEEGGKIKGREFKMAGSKTRGESVFPSHTQGSREVRTNLELEC